MLFFARSDVGKEQQQGSNERATTFHKELPVCPLPRPGTHTKMVLPAHFPTYTHTNPCSAAITMHGTDALLHQGPCTMHLTAPVSPPPQPTPLHCTAHVHTMLLVEPISVLLPSSICPPTTLHPTPTHIACMRRRRCTGAHAPCGANTALAWCRRCMAQWRAELRCELHVMCLACMADGLHAGWGGAWSPSPPRVQAGFETKV